MAHARFPTFFLSHGGGPWPWIDGLKEQYALTAREFGRIPEELPVRPAAVLVITGHWEADGFAVSTAAQPSMEYDYYGFPEHTYRIRYPAPGAPVLAARVRRLLEDTGIACGEDPERGFDHGTFVPMSLMYPQADMPTVLLSMKSGYDPATHLQVGHALSVLRDEGVLIVGSGLTYHNMQGFGRPGSTPVAEAFEAWLNDTIGLTASGGRDDRLLNWTRAPGARLAHPREDHLLPLMVAAGAAGEDPGRRLFVDHVMSVAMGSYRFG